MSTLADVDQLAMLNARKPNSVVVIHAAEDGVINPDYLRLNINDDVMYKPENAGKVSIITDEFELEVEETIHIVPEKHMSPYLCAEQIVDIVCDALNI